VSLYITILRKKVRIVRWKPVIVRKKSEFEIKIRKLFLFYGGNKLYYP